MTVTGVLQSFNVCFYTWWTWYLSRSAFRVFRRRRRLADLERERWGRLTAAGSTEAAGTAETEARTEAGTAIPTNAPANALTGDLTQGQCRMIVAYIVADVSARWPPVGDDRRNIASAAAAPAIDGYIASVMADAGLGPGAGPAGAGPERRDRVPDETARGFTARLLETFRRPGQEPEDYRDQILAAAEHAERLPALVIPALLLRRGPNDRARLESPS